MLPQAALVYKVKGGGISSEILSTKYFHFMEGSVINPLIRKTPMMRWLYSTKFLTTLEILGKGILFIAYIVKKTIHN